MITLHYVQENTILPFFYLSVFPAYHDKQGTIPSLESFYKCDGPLPKV